jgi:hypothetical protein
VPGHLLLEEAFGSHKNRVVGTEFESRENRYVKADGKHLKKSAEFWELRVKERRQGEVRPKGYGAQRQERALQSCARTPIEVAAYTQFPSQNRPRLHSTESTPAQHFSGSPSSKEFRGKIELDLF